jgi:probable HAF family extracellular repeat protein
MFLIKNKLLRLILLSMLTFFCLTGSLLAQSYNFISLPGRRANDINNYGQVVGNFQAPGLTGGSDTHGFVWNAASGLKDLGTFGGLYSNANAINNRGQIVGYADIAGATSSSGRHACLWNADGSMVDLGGNYSIAQGINDQGKVVGYYFDVNTGRSQAFVWSEADKVQFLSGMARAYAINNSGQIAGISTTGQACILDASGNFTSLGYPVSRDVNESGQVCGEYPSFFYSQTGGVQGMGCDYESGAYALNNLGETVGGTKMVDGRTHAFIWTAEGGLADLNNLVVDKPSQLTLTFGLGINDAGDIVGYATDSGFGLHAFLLKPDTSQPPSHLPLPGSLLLLSSGLVGVVAGGLRKVNFSAFQISAK